MITRILFIKRDIMTKVNDFDVQRFDSCLRVALYKNFITINENNAETITYEKDRIFTKRSSIKSRDYTKSLTPLKPSVYCKQVGNIKNLKNRIVTQKTNDKIKRSREKNDIDKACDLIRPQWVEINREYDRCKNLKAFVTIAFDLLSRVLNRSEVAIFAHIINFAIDYFISYKRQLNK